MLTTLFKSMGLTRVQEASPLFPRQVDLSGNLLKFSMPENFSQEFPADDMLESVVLENPNVYSALGDVLVVQRWWGFFTSGFIKKDVGTLQMTISVRKLETSENLNIANPLDLIKAISLDLHATYDEFNLGVIEEDDQVIFSNLADDFVEFHYNQQRWIRYGFGQERGSLTNVFAIPITHSNYLTVAFSFAPSARISMREFMDEYAQPHIDRIMETVLLKYDLSNAVTGLIKDYSDQTLEDMMPSSFQ